jgi:cob(I)alamin adenosyltransferase
MAERKGLIIVHTGNGKGKTTAALGLGMRSWGQGFRVLVLQFIKGNWKYGELKAIAQMGPGFEIRQMGEGFVDDSGQNVATEHRQVAVAALQTAKTEILSGKWDLVILDEINNAVCYGLLPLKDVLELLDQKPPELHLVLTGRGAKAEIIELADLVTEMREIKHPFQKGIRAQKGIEF